MGGNKKRTFQKAFITRITTHSFLSLVAQLNKAHIKTVRSMGFASLLKVDLKKIPQKFLKCVVERFDHYSNYFKLLDGEEFPVTTFEVGMPIGGRK